MATSKNLSFTLGEDWQVVVNCADGHGTAYTPADAIFEIKPLTGAAPVLSLQASLGGLIIINNQILIDVTPAQQTEASFIATAYHYQIRAIKTDGSVSDQVAGLLSIQPTII